MNNPSNHDLHILLTEISCDLKQLIKDGIETKIWQKEHEDKDEKRFSNLNKYAASIAAVASSIGVCGAYIWQKITG